MCIRDSQWQAAGATHIAVNTMRAGFATVEQHLAALRQFKAVSYTHLRAHETVLDLVCRLLLEKKKKNTQTQLQRHQDTDTHHTLQKQNNTDTNEIR